MDEPATGEAKRPRTTEPSFSRWCREAFAAIHDLTEIPQATYFEQIVSSIRENDPLALARAIWTDIDDNGIGAADAIDSKEVLQLAFLHANELDFCAQQTDVCWLYGMLSIHELVKAMVRQARGGGAGPLVEETVIDEISEIISHATVDSPVDLVREKMQTWFRIGKWLKAFVREFGSGCLFFMTRLVNPTTYVAFTRATATGSLMLLQSRKDPI